FTDADREGAPPVVVVSESAARHYWGTDDPIAKRLRMGENLERTVTVIGIVPDTRYRDLRDARASIYFPLRQSFFPYMPMKLAIRTSGPPAELVRTIRRVIAETEPGVALASAAPFATYLEEPLAQPRLNALLLAVFAGAAVALAPVGPRDPGYRGGIAASSGAGCLFRARTPGNARRSRGGTANGIVHEPAGAPRSDCAFLSRSGAPAGEGRRSFRQGLAPDTRHPTP